MSLYFLHFNKMTDRNPQEEPEQDTYAIDTINTLHLTARPITPQIQASENFMRAKNLYDSVGYETHGFQIAGMYEKGSLLLLNRDLKIATILHVPEATGFVSVIESLETQADIMKLAQDDFGVCAVMPEKAKLADNASAMAAFNFGTKFYDTMTKNCARLLVVCDAGSRIIDQTTLLGAAVMVGSNRDIKHQLTVLTEYASLREKTLIPFLKQKNRGANQQVPKRSEFIAAYREFARMARGDDSAPLYILDPFLKHKSLLRSSIASGLLSILGQNIADAGNPNWGNNQEG